MLETLFSVGYAASIIWAGWRVARDLHGPTDRRQWMLVGFAAAALVVTWGFMLQMVLIDMTAYPSFTAWLSESHLFFDAYRDVTGTAAAWWWSAQLIAWVVAAVCFAHREGEQHGIRIVPYVWLGLAVAMSVALPLFLLRLAQSAHQRGLSPTRLTPSLLTCTVLALATVIAVPIAGPEAVFALVVGSHAAFVLPGVFRAEPPLRMSATVLYCCVAVVATGIHWLATMAVWQSFGAAAPRALVDAVLARPAQASITADLLFTVLVSALAVGAHSTRARGWLYGPLALVLSPATACIALILMPSSTPRQSDRGPSP
jgi:hypothetical protein